MFSPLKELWRNDHWPLIRGDGRHGGDVKRIVSTARRALSEGVRSLMDAWVSVCAADEVVEGSVKQVRYGGRAIALTRVEGSIFAIDDACPHHGASLAQGDLEGYFLYCPLHAWSFDVRSGEAFFPKGAQVACFGVEERENQVFLRLNASSTVR
jgi:nitrite reductase/ring-hydroxylating ferredoxin subunit